MASAHWYCYIRPQAKQRARMGRFGVYTPRQTVDFESQFAAHIRKSLHTIIPNGVPCKCAITFRMPLTVGKKPGEPHIVRPDNDNLQKSAFDAMKMAGLLQDDCIIWDVHSRKIYADTDGPSIEFRLIWDEVAFEKQQERARKAADKQLKPIGARILRGKGGNVRIPRKSKPRNSRG